MAEISADPFYSQENMERHRKSAARMKSAAGGFMEESEMRIEHVALYVKDLEHAKNFFIKYFGAEAGDGYHNPKTGFRSYFLTFADGARLEIMNRQDALETKKELLQTGYIHIAFSTGSKEKVDGLTKRLEADGYQVISAPRITGDGYYESCILDLEGNQIEITV